MSVREHRIATNWAEGIKDMVDIMYPDAKKIVFVMDNLNIHKAVFLYKRYPSEEVRRIIKKLEIHYAPKHGKRNTLAAKVNWHFRTSDARTRLSLLYPIFTAAS